MPNCIQKVRGRVDILIEYDDGTPARREWHNTILTDGKKLLARVLTGQTSSVTLSQVQRMVFGSSGTANGVERSVDASRHGLYGPAVIAKPVIASIDPGNATEAVFTAVLTKTDAVGETMNEMGLQLGDESYYAMSTFGDISKTGTMQITFNWRINFV